MFEFPPDQQKTADNLRASLESMASSLNVVDMSTSFFFVTDQGSNIKAALNSRYHRIPCSCHCLSTALKHALPGGPGDKGDSDALQALDVAINDVKTLVRYVKKSGLNAQLTKTLLQENETRWNSLLMMLESVISCEEELRRLLMQNSQSHRIDNINFGLLTDLIAFLQPIKEATKQLEGDKHATIHKVLLWKSLLLQRTESHPLDSDLIKQLKERFHNALVEKWEMTETHKLAVFLNPQYKSLRKLSADERLAVHQLAREYIDMLKRNDAAVRDGNGSQASTSR